MLQLLTCQVSCSWHNDQILNTLIRELRTIPSVSSGVQSRDKLIVEDFLENWEELLGLSRHLRDKERRSIRRALNTMKLEGVARMIQAESDMYGVFNISLIRSPVKNFIYIVFNLSCAKAIIYEVNFKRNEVKGWGEKIISADKTGVVLEGSSLPTGSNWMVHDYTFPLQCTKCSIKGDVERWAS